MEKQASSRSCFVCGVENPIGLHLSFFLTHPGEVTASFVASKEYQSYPGVLHGGIIAAILDEAAGRVNLQGFSPRFMYTARLEIRYRNNVPIGQPLMVIGRSVKNKGRMAESWAGIYGPGESLLAEAKALYIDIPNTPEASVLDDFGWKVYPDEQAK
jgi:acyl-coenzyme A thioesterase PaaI-like protein